MNTTRIPVATSPPENRIDVLNVNILRERGVADYAIVMDEATYFVHRVGPVIEAQVVLSEYEVFHQSTSIHRSPVPSSHRWLQSFNPARTGGLQPLLIFRPRVL